MAKKLFLLDGMALVYRAHFALINRPIYTSKGFNSSGLYGFTQTLLEITREQSPTHLAVAFDTSAPTARDAVFADYKANRQKMPEDITAALPHVYRMLEAFRIPVLTCDGYEADDIIGTLVRVAEKEGFESYMVTQDKDFGQLITERTFLYKPSRMGDRVEILGLPEIRQRWGVERPGQVIDVLALMGDTSDNIPGVPGIGEKTATKLIGQYGSVEEVLAHAAELTPKLRATLETNREAALLSKRLATIDCASPCLVDLNTLELRSPDEAKLKAILVEFEFNSIGRRLFGDSFKSASPTAPSQSAPTKPAAPAPGKRAELDLFPDLASLKPLSVPAAPESLKRLGDTPHDYRVVDTPAARAELIRTLQSESSFALAVAASDPDAKTARLLGLGFAVKPHAAYYVPVPESADAAKLVVEEFLGLLENETIEKVGYDLKFALSVLRWAGFNVRGKLFDTMLAHSLIEPDMRHRKNYLAEVCLGYSPLPSPQAPEGELQLPSPQQWSDPTAEEADLALQLRAVLAPLLHERKQEQVFYEIETPLIPVLVAMEHAGVALDTGALGEFASSLAREMDRLEKRICEMAKREFNLNSSRQLGEILFEQLKICEKPKKTKTGLYATDEQTLTALAGDHEIVRLLLEYRGAAKLKSTYADALPAAVFPRTRRVHTTYHQTQTATGRLNSQNPNLQNIPIRSEQGQEIRKAFVAGSKDTLLLSADYSQIELRIIAALSREAGLLEAFRTGADVHTATAAKVFGVATKDVTAEMRRKAKMVNYGIAYGISPFGLAQRLAISRAEAAEIINSYFNQFSGIREYIDQTIAFARQHGYVETVTGRRRYLRDIRSANQSVRSGAERNAINMPIQGTAADMIKIAMIRIDRELREREMKTRMLLQVHDELVFELHRAEEQAVRSLVSEQMTRAIPLDVPIEIDLGAGTNWLAAH